MERLERRQNFKTEGNNINKSAEKEQAAYLTRKHLINTSHYFEYPRIC